MGMENDCGTEQKELSIRRSLALLVVMLLRGEGGGGVQNDRRYMLVRYERKGLWEQENSLNGLYFWRKELDA